MKTIKLKDKKFNIEWSGTSNFLLDKLGENLSDMQISAEAVNNGSGFANVVILTWVMLDKSARQDYKSPEAFAQMFLPIPEASTIDTITSALQDAASLMQVQI